MKILVEKSCPSLEKKTVLVNVFVVEMYYWFLKFVVVFLGLVAEETIVLVRFYIDLTLRMSPLSLKFQSELVVVVVKMSRGTMHVSRNKGQRYYCVTCGKGFAPMFCVSRHRGSIHGTKKLRCTVCGRPYTY